MKYKKVYISLVVKIILKTAILQKIVVILKNILKNL